MYSTKHRNGAMVTGSEDGAIAPRNLSRYTHSHLKFALGEHTALLPTHQIMEVVTIPTASLTPMPNMPPAMLGLINRRSQVLWVTDLALLLGIPVSAPNTQLYNLILLQIGQTLVALRVQEIMNILSIPGEKICPPPSNTSTWLMPFLRGCFLQDGEVVLMLNAEAILRAPALQQGQ